MFNFMIHVRAAFVIVATGLIAGCGIPMDIEAPNGYAAEISVATSAIKFDPRINRVATALDVTVNNTGEHAFVVGQCGTEFERREGGEWRRVWFAICHMETPDPSIAEVQPGGTYRATFTVMVDHPPPGTGATTWPEPYSGLFRLKLPIGTSNGALPGNLRTSPQFNLQVEQ